MIIFLASVLNIYDTMMRSWCRRNGAATARSFFQIVAVASSTSRGYALADLLRCKNHQLLYTLPRTSVMAPVAATSVMAPVAATSLMALPIDVYRHM